MSTHISIHQYTTKTMNNPIHSVYVHEKGDKCKQFINRTFSTVIFHGLRVTAC